MRRCLVGMTRRRRLLRRSRTCSGLPLENCSGSDNPIASRARSHFDLRSGPRFSARDRLMIHCGSEPLLRSRSRPSWPPSGHRDSGSGSKTANQPIQLIRQPRQTLRIQPRRVRQFGHQLRIAMNLADVPIDVFSHLMLLFRRRGDLGVHVTDHVHRLTNQPETAARFTDTGHRLLRHFQARVHLMRDLTGALGKVAQQTVDFCRGIGRAFGQRPNFIGHHRKPATLLTGPRCFNGGVQRQQVGLLGNRANGPEDRLNVVAVALKLLHRLGGLFDFLAQAINAGHRRINLLLTFAGLTLATVGRVSGLAARACDFVSGSDHFMERRGHHVHRLTLAPGRFGHVAGDLSRALGGREDLGRGAADVLDQVANRRQELVEPVGQLRGFVAATDLQVLGQVAFALGNAFQAAGHAADRPHDEVGEAGADDGKHHGQHGGDDRDQPGQLRGRAHHVGLFDQADEGPAQLLRRPDVGHVALTVELDFHQPFAGLGQLRVALAEAAHCLEVVLRLLRIHQHGTGIFQQHQVAGFTELDLFDDFGELLERHVDADHAAIGAQFVVDGAHGTDVSRVILGPIVGLGAERFARFGLGSLVPGALARVVVAQLGIVRPRHITARRRAENGIGVGGVAVAQVLQEGEDLFVHLALRNALGVGAHVGFEAVVGVLDQRLAWPGNRRSG